MTDTAAVERVIIELIPLTTCGVGTALATKPITAKPELRS